MPNAAGQFVHALKHQCALGFFVEGHHQVAAELLHCSTHFETGCSGNQISMKRLTLQRAGNGAVGADQPQIEPKLLGDRQCKGMASAGDQNNFYPLLAGSAQRLEVFF